MGLRFEGKEDAGMTSVGKQYRYVARVGKSTGRYGQVVTVLKWHRSRVLCRFPDGFVALFPGRCLRKLSDNCTTNLFLVAVEGSLPKKKESKQREV